MYRKLLFLFLFLTPAAAFAVDFGSVTVGSVSAEQQIAFYYPNTRITDIRFPAGFHAGPHNTCFVSFVGPSGCNVTAVFAPTSAIVYSGNISVTWLTNVNTFTDLFPVSGTGVAVPDTTPNPFSFTSQSGVALSTATTSNTVTPTGYNAATSISVSGGSYSINGGAFTSTAGTISPGQNVAVRQTSSGAYNTTTTATLTIGGVPGTFSVTTLPADTTPDPFSFTSQSGVALSTATTSNTVTPTGYNAATTISVTGGNYSINGGAFVSTAGTISPGQNVVVRQTSSGAYNTTTTATLTIGGVPGTFSVTTVDTTFSQVTVQTAPAGLQIMVDGTMFTAPRSFSWSLGTNHNIATISPQGGGGTRSVFANWSDGGAISHTVAPTADLTYTANFTTQYSLTMSVSPAGGGTIGTSPSSVDGYYDSGTTVQLSAFSNSGYAFTGWSGDGSGSANPLMLAMSGPRDVAANFGVVAASGLRFVPVAPCRVADTRNAPGPFGGPVMDADSTRNFTIAATSCGIPSNALAYSLNATVVPTTGTLGYLSIWPAGQPQPGVSTLNSLDGRIKANAAIVGAGSGGAVTVYVSDQTHVILDINGYFALPASAPSGLMFYPVTPCRVMDTRLPGGPLGAPILAGGASRTVPVLSSTCGLPATATAYSLSMTVIPTGTLDYLTAWPTGAAPPWVSTLNDQTGTVVANAAIVPAGTGGSIDVFVTQETHLIVDVNGYFAPPGPSGLLFYVATPCRVVDTRNPPAPLAGPALLGQRDFNITAGPCGAPATTKAYSLNATVVPHGFLNYLTLWPAGQPQPLVSTLNSYDASIVSNAVIVPTTSGMISAFSTDTTDLILDSNGFFAP